MIPGPFEYHRPASVTEAVGLKSTCWRTQSHPDDETASCCTRASDRFTKYR